MPNMMAALPNVGGALCSWPPCIADADIIFLPCGFFYLVFSSPNLSRVKVVISLALEGNEVGATISGNLISNVRFADDIFL